MIVTGIVIMVNRRAIGHGLTDIGHALVIMALGLGGVILLAAFTWAAWRVGRLVIDERHYRQSHELAPHCSCAVHGALPATVPLYSDRPGRQAVSEPLRAAIPGEPYRPDYMLYPASHD